MRTFSTSLLLSAVLAPGLLAQITPGNLIVTRVGAGANPLSNAATEVFLDEYDQTGTFVQTIALPTAASGSNLPVTNSGTATSEGQISQSADGRYLITVGYAAAPGTASIVSTTSASTPRVVCRIGLDGTVDSSTGLTDAYSANNIRSATSFDGSQFWTAGTASAANGPGVRYVANLGDTTSTQLSTSVINIRVVGIYNGQLYCSSASGAFQGVSQVGTGLPATSGQTIALLPGFPTTSGPSAYAFYFASPSTLYVADDRTNGSGGVQKWTESGGTWTLAYTLAPAANIGCRGVSGFNNGGTVTLFATTTNNQLVSVVDGGASSPFNTLAAAPTNTALRSVQFVRTPSSLVYSGTPCANNNGTPTVGTTGLPVTGSPGFAFTTSNAGPLSLVLFLLRVGSPSPFGIPVPGTPPCALIFVLPDVLSAQITDLAGDASTALPIPPVPALVGASLSAQVAAFDLSLVGFDLPIGTSDALEITIGN